MENKQAEQKFWEWVINSEMVDFLKAKQAEYEAQGLIPTLDLLIEDLENNQ